VIRLQLEIAIECPCDPLLPVVQTRRSGYDPSTDDVVRLLQSTCCPRCQTTREDAKVLTALTRFEIVPGSVRHE